MRLLPFLKRSDPECFVATLCGIDFGALGAADQVALIVAMRQNAGRPEVRQRQEELFTWDALGPSLGRSPDSLPLLAEAVQVICARDFVKILKYALRPDFYEKFTARLCEGEQALRVQCALIIHYLVARGGEKTAECLRRCCGRPISVFSVFGQKDAEKYEKLLAGAECAQLRLNFPPSAGHSQLYNINGKEQFFCPPAQRIVSRLRLDNEAFHKLVCEVNGYGTDLALSPGARAACVLETLARTLVGVFQSGQRVLHERKILVRFYVDVRVSGESNLRRFVGALCAQKATLGQSFHALGMKEFLHFRRDPEAHLAVKPTSYLEEQLVSKFLGLDRQQDDRDALQNKFIQYALLDDEHDVRIEDLAQFEQRYYAGMRIAVSELVDDSLDEQQIQVASRDTARIEQNKYNIIINDMLILQKLLAQEPEYPAQEIVGKIITSLQRFKNILIGMRQPESDRWKEVSGADEV